MRMYWGVEVYFMRQPLYPHGKNPQYPLARRMGGPQNQCGHGVEEKDFQPPQGIEPRSEREEKQQMNLNQTLILYD
jgi:hypothetical protein